MSDWDQLVKMMAAQGKKPVEIRTKSDWDTMTDRMARHFPKSERNNFVRHMEREWWNVGDTEGGDNDEHIR